jgi:hypothetical protein
MYMLLVLALLLVTAGAAPAAPQAKPAGSLPVFSEAVAFDVSWPVSEIAQQATSRAAPLALSDEPLDIRPDRGPVVKDQGFSGDGAIQGFAEMCSGLAESTAVAAAIPAPLASFEGLSNQDNFNVFDFRVNPPDPVGDVGPNHYVEMINLIFGVYDKNRNLLLGPGDTGSLWAGFEIPDCTDPSGDPIVIYDQFTDRWILSQFTSRFTPAPKMTCSTIVLPSRRPAI